MRPEELLTPSPAGLWCPAGDFHIDPTRPVARALVTHGHADHARPGHGQVLATARDAGDHGGALRRRLRRGDAGGRLWRAADARRRALSASTRPGTFSVRRRSRWKHKGLRIVASGDYKRQADPTCAPFEPVACDVFISEATFALPVFRHPPAGGRDRQAHRLGGAVSRARASGRRLFAGQGAARHPHAARCRLRAHRSTCTAPWRSSAGSTRNSAWRWGRWSRRRWRRARRATSPGRSSSARRARSPNAGHGAFPIR